MSKTTKAEYRAALAEAEGQWEDQSAEPMSEAERFPPFQVRPGLSRHPTQTRAYQLS